MPARHFHTGPEAIIIGALGVAIVFHAFRFIAAKLAEQGGAAGQLGRGIAGVFAFPAAA